MTRADESRSPSFSFHALNQARRRFGFRLNDADLAARLTRALLQAEVVDQEPGGYAIAARGRLRWMHDDDLKKVTLRGRLGPRIVEFVVDPDSGCVVTVVDPDEALQQVVDRRDKRRKA